MSTGKPCSKKSLVRTESKKVIGDPLNVMLKDSQVPLVSVVRSILEQADYAKFKMLEKK